MAAGLDLQNRLSAFAAADNDQQVADELFALRVAHVQFGRPQADHRVFHNLNRAFDDRFSSVNQSHRLLPHQHCMSDFRSIRQIVQTHVENSNSRRIHRRLKFVDERLCDDFAFMFQARFGDIAT